MQGSSSSQPSSCDVTDQGERWQLFPQPYKEQMIAESFVEIEQNLRSALAEVQLQQAALQNETSAARVFGVRLLGDALAIKVADLLIEPQPQVIEADHAVDREKICWLDLILEPRFESYRRDEGSYHCRINKCNALVVMSAWDHDLIVTCRQLVYTQTYLCDKLAEKNTLESMAKALSSCNDIASGFIETNRATLSLISDKLQSLKGDLSQLAWTSQGYDSEPRRKSANDEKTTHRQDKMVGESAAQEMRPVKGEVGAGLASSRQWSSRDLKQLLPWFKLHEHLPDDSIVKQFEKDFSHVRSCSAIRAAVWRETRKNRNWRGQKRSRSKRRLKSQ
ncbi:hypothetical protein N7523_005769 [Penicillium sp. IBT 18751x]|nr:hypothetical protein N7523_005639 [Penicillium sp. IBT 18751x]KAJ6118018.1 hypothetical protein N7523_005769 [Penicillium sp. IBT 18751x]